MSKENPQGTINNPIEEQDEDPPAVKAGMMSIGVTGKATTAVSVGLAAGSIAGSATALVAGSVLTGVGVGCIAVAGCTYSVYKWIDSK